MDSMERFFAFTVKLNDDSTLTRTSREWVEKNMMSQYPSGSEKCACSCAQLPYLTARSQWVEKNMMC